MAIEASVRYLQEAIMGFSSVLKVITIGFIRPFEIAHVIASVKLSVQFEPLSLKYF
jgi:hypothetical protein